jgi:hypothetical protein
MDNREKWGMVCLLVSLVVWTGCSPDSSGSARPDRLAADSSYTCDDWLHELDVDEREEFAVAKRSTMAKVDRELGERQRVSVPQFVRWIDVSCRNSTSESHLSMVSSLAWIQQGLPEPIKVMTPLSGSLRKVVGGVRWGLGHFESR